MSELIAGRLCQVGEGVWRLIAPNAGMLTGPGTNTYFVGNAEGVVVIDPGPDDPLHIQQILKNAPGPITAIAVSHTHRDHSPGASELKTYCDAPLIGLPAPATPENDQSFAPDIEPADGDHLGDGLTRLTVLHTPGHASNHVCYWQAEAGRLFTGDHMMNGSTVVIAPPDGSMSQYISSLRELLKMPLNCIEPGHGDTITKPLQLLRWTIQHRLERENTVLEALRVHAPCTVDQLVSTVYGDVDERLHPVAKYSLWAHLLKLVEDGEARDDHNVWTLS